MNFCSHNGMSVSGDGNSFHELSVDPPQSTCRVMGDLSVNDLGNSIAKFLNIDDEQKSLSDSILPPAKNGVEKEDIVEEPYQSKLSIITSEKCLSKCATFPCSSKITSSAAYMDEENEVGEANDREVVMTPEVLAQNADAKSVNPPYPRSISLPTPLKLVSAMKGSREKQGKLNVKWAPDVYDPPPTAVSHVVTNKSQRHRSDTKKNGKNKQKGGGKSLRGSRGKDKKQTRKYGGSSNRCFKSLEDDERVVDFNEPQVELVDFNVGSPDPYCGSSFLKKSVTKLHFSVAEAT